MNSFVGGVSLDAPMFDRKTSLHPYCNNSTKKKDDYVQTVVVMTLIMLQRTSVTFINARCAFAVAFTRPEITQ